jgi:Cft2 family RNA processing exonuclease
MKELASRYIKDTCEYTEKAVANSRQQVIPWLGVQQLLTVKEQYVTKYYTGPLYSSVSG